MVTFFWDKELNLEQMIVLTKQLDRLQRELNFLSQA